MMPSHRDKIGFIIPCFGVLPDYVDFFIISARHLASIADFIFFTDQSIKSRSQAVNVFFEKMSLADFNDLCKEKLEVNASITSGYKLCDLKPMYGLLFEAHLREYKYWGHCDFDMIFGDVERLIRKYEYEKFDVFCVQETYASGPFQIFRNTEKVNRFFTHSPTWKDVFLKPGYIGFDEAGDVIRELWAGKNIWECKGEVYSMTHLLKNRELIDELGLKVSMKPLITEGFTKGTTVIFEKGRLILSPDHTELYIYHFMNRKNRLLFNDQLFDKEAVAFRFSDNGFNTQNAVELFIGLPISLINRYWIRIKRKIKRR